MQLSVLGGALCVLAASIFVLGCGGSQAPNSNDENAPWKKGGKGSRKAGDGSSGKRTGKGLQAVAAKSYDAVLKGKVVGEGDPTSLRSLDTAHLDSLTGKQDAGHCKKGNQHQHKYVIGGNNNVGNVFVWIEPETPKQYFKVPEDQVKAHAGKVVLHQPNCNFTPHCLVLFPSHRVGGGRTDVKPTGQQFFVKNDDTVTHNTKFQGGPLNPVNDKTYEAGSENPVSLKPDRQEVTISCGIHPYMHGYARVFDHPWAAVSKVTEDPKAKDFGTFEIKGLPAGVPVRLFAWHEEGKYLNEGGSAGQLITLKPGEKEVEFKMSYPK
jgi:hypothetical protein